MSQARQRMTTFRVYSREHTVQDLVLIQENAPQTHRTTHQIERSSRCCQIFGVYQGTSPYSSRTVHLHTVHGTPSSCYDMKPQTSLDQMSGQRIHQTSIQLTIGSGGWYKDASIRQRFGTRMIWSSALPVSGLSWSKASLIKPLNSGGQGESLHSRKWTTLWTAAKLNFAFCCLTLRFRIFCSVTTARCIYEYSLRYSSISDFQVSADSAKLVLGSGDICLRCFMNNFFKKQSAKFVENPSSFTKVMAKHILVCFYAPQCI